MTPTRLRPTSARSSLVALQRPGPERRCGRRCGVLARADTSKGGGAGVVDKGTDIDFSKLKSLLKKKPPLYRVLLHNDNMNRREYVVQALIKVVDGMTMEDAIQVMQEAHQNNIALVTITSQETAEEYVTGLRRNGLTSTLEPTGSGGGSESDQ